MLIALQLPHCTGNAMNHDHQTSFSAANPGWLNVSYKQRYAFHVLTAKKLSKQTNADAKSVQQPVDKTLRTFDTNHRVISILRSLLVEEAQEPHSPNGSTVLLVLSPFVLKKTCPHEGAAVVLFHELTRSRSSKKSWNDQALILKAFTVPPIHHHWEI